MIWRARQFEFRFPRPVLVMGVVNVTPDSFSDGGQFLDPEAAVAHARRLIAEGADLIDVGGESTRPNAQPVSEDEELRRVMPVLETLGAESKVPVSIDTSKPEVARRALAAGASIVNDVAANRTEPAMWELVAGAAAGYVLMHMQGTPQIMHRDPHYDDVVQSVGNFFTERLQQLDRAQLAIEQVVLDVGIGFGKTAEHNLELLARFGEFRRWQRPLLLGVSRKSFIGRVTEAPQIEDRLSGSIASACWTVPLGLNIVRTHDVAATRRALRMTEAIEARATQVKR